MFSTGFMRRKFLKGESAFCMAAENEEEAEDEAEADKGLNQLVECSELNLTFVRSFGIDK